jgi:hypothetical protein
VTDLQFIAAIVNSIAWPVAAVGAVALARRELIGLLGRLDSVQFRGTKLTFAALDRVEKVVAVAAKDAGSSDEQSVARYEASEFSVVEALASAAPRQAVIDAWGLLEYELNVASDRLAPDQPHGWPHVARNLENWDKWTVLYPAVLELRHLRDSTVGSSRPPSSADAARYVSVAQDLATTIRTSFMSQASKVHVPGQQGSRR